VSSRSNARQGKASAYEGKAKHVLLQGKISQVPLQAREFVLQVKASAFARHGKCYCKTRNVPFQVKLSALRTQAKTRELA
jgi:hypothetical protein